MNAESYKVYDLKTFSDERGSLTPIELKDFIDFEVKRIYSVHKNNTKRGGHCHLAEQEFFFMASGECTARLHNGKKWIEVEMLPNQTAIFVDNHVWHEFDNFSDDGVLVALSSTNYNSARNDYIEDFNEFLKNV
jgi:dTDP-4-dehydrorhamnose 3,5-epimerase-like enzyme